LFVVLFHHIVDGINYVVKHYSYSNGKRILTKLKKTKK